MIHYGDVAVGSTIYIPFATYEGTDGASVTMTGLAVTDIEIYKDGSTTQRSSDNGYALLDTDGIDFDGITGIHGFSIDLSDNSDAGFYAVGSQYWVVVSSVTVDSQTVNFIAATFRIAPPKLAPVHINLGFLEQSVNVHRAIGPFVDVSTGAPKTSLTLGNITAARIIQTTTVTRTAITLAGSGNNQFTNIADGYWEFDLTTTDTGTLGYVQYTFRDDDVFQPVIATATVVPANVYDSLVNDTDKLDASVVQWLGTAVTAATAGVPNVNMTEIAGDSTDASDLGAAIDNANNLLYTDVVRVSGDATAADNLELAYDGTGYAGGTTKQQVDAVAISGDTNAATILESMMDAVADPTGGTVFTVDTSGFAPTTTQFETSNGDATDDHYNNMTVLWVTGALKGSKYDVSDYVGATARWTVPTMTDTPSNGDTFTLI